MQSLIRKIIHMDMDAFYASIEQRDNPELRNKPVAVGGGSERGVVAAASYEARKYGVRSAMPGKIALVKCKHLVFVKPRFEVYREVSHQIMEVFLDYTDLVEPLSLDEAYLDVTENKFDIPSATLIAREIKDKIKEKTGLTASAGISINKFLAKTASDMDKPDGLYLIKPEEGETFIETLPIEKFFGIGKVTADKMRSLGIRNGFDLKQLSVSFLTQHFGKVGQYYYQISRGIDHRAVNPNRIRKSFGKETTFEKDLMEKTEIEATLSELGKRLFNKINERQIRGKTLTLKVKFNDFKQITRSKTTPLPIVTYNRFWSVSQDLLQTVDFDRPVRLLGLAMSNFASDEDYIQLEIDFYGSQVSEK
jgi:DNA polymerase-4